MADRRSLKKKAVETGKSVAGTLGEGARQIKKDVKGKVSKDDKPRVKDDEGVRRSAGKRTIRVTYSSETGKWRVAGPTAGFGTFDSKKPAVTKAKQVFESKDEYDGVEIETKRGALDSDASFGNTEVTGREPDEPDDVAETDDEPGRFQKFATKFADTVNGKAASAVEAPESEDGEMDGEESESPDPMAALFGAGGGDGDGPELAFMGGGMDDEDRGAPTLPGMMGGQTEGDNESQGPMLPGFGMGGGQEGGQGMGQPSLPMFGGGQGEQGEPQMPMFGGPEPEGEDREGQQGPQMPMFGGGGGNQPQFPGFGMQADESDSDTNEDMSNQPWMF